MKPSLKVTKTRKLFNWVIDGEEDFTLIDKNGKIIEGVCHLTAAQHAKMFIECMLEKIDKLVATKDINAREIAEKMSDITLRPVPLECPGGGICPLFSLPYRMD